MNRAIEHQRVNLAFDFSAKRPVADEERLQRRHDAAGVRHRSYEVDRILVADELCDLNDERGVRLHAEADERIGGRGRGGAMDVDPVRHNGDQSGVDPTLDQHALNGLRHRDDRRRAPVLPPRAGVGTQGEIHPPRDDHRRACANRRQRTRGDRVCRVRVDDVNPLTAHRRAQLDRRPRIELTQRVARYDLESGIGGTLGQRLAGTRSDHGSMAASRQLGGKPECLPLAAAPAVFRVDVQNTKRHRAQLPRLGVTAQGWRPTDTRHEARDTRPAEAPID